MKFTKKLAAIYKHPAPLRAIFSRLMSANIGTFRFKMAINSHERPHYAYILFNSAKLAKKLGHKEISVLEFGVAGGTGLVLLEKYATQVEKLFGVKIQIYGFDLSVGLPAPKDYRDLPYHWKEGFFAMNVDKLKKKLKKSTLVIGDVKDTSKDFFKKYNPAPIAAIAHDMDYYSSTKAGLEMLRQGDARFLPRVFCYFDDTIGSDTELFSDFAGQRLAINEFNTEGQSIKLAKPYYLTCGTAATWQHKIWIAHFFEHEKYNTFVSDDDQQLPV